MAFWRIRVRPRPAALHWFEVAAFALLMAALGAAVGTEWSAEANAPAAQCGKAQSSAAVITR